MASDAVDGETQTLTLRVSRDEAGKLGIGLNLSNRVTQLGLQAASGLRIWDLVIAVDQEDLGGRSLAETMQKKEQKATHELTVVRLTKAPPKPGAQHVLTDELLKQSPAMGAPWQARTFQLDGETLWYRAGDGVTKRVPLSTITTVRVVDHVKFEFHFNTNATDRTYKLRAHSSSQLYKWVTALQMQHAEKLDAENRASVHGKNGFQNAASLKSEYSTKSGVERTAF